MKRCTARKLVQKIALASPPEELRQTRCFEGEFACDTAHALWACGTDFFFQPIVQCGENQCNAEAGKCDDCSAGRLFGCANKSARSECTADGGLTPSPCPSATPFCVGEGLCVADPGSGMGGAAGASGSAGMSMGPAPMLMADAAPKAWFNMAYSQGFSVTNGQGETIGWKVSAGALPPGLSLSANSGETIQVVGKPSQEGMFAFTLEATMNGQVATLPQQLLVGRKRWVAYVDEPAQGGQNTLYRIDLSAAIPAPEEVGTPEAGFGMSHSGEFQPGTTTFVGPGLDSGGVFHLAAADIAKNTWQKATWDGASQAAGAATVFTSDTRRSFSPSGEYYSYRLGSGGIMLVTKGIGSAPTEILPPSGGGSILGWVGNQTLLYLDPSDATMIFRATINQAGEVTTGAWTKRDGFDYQPLPLSPDRRYFATIFLKSTAHEIRVADFGTSGSPTLTAATKAPTMMDLCGLVRGKWNTSLVFETSYSQCQGGDHLIATVANQSPPLDIDLVGAEAVAMRPGELSGFTTTTTGGMSPIYALRWVDLSSGVAVSQKLADGRFRLAMSPDGSTLVACERDPAQGTGRLLLGRMTNSGPPTLVELPTGGKTYLPRGFSPDGRFLELAADNGKQFAAELFVLDLEPAMPAAPKLVISEAPNSNILDDSTFTADSAVLLAQVQSQSNQLWVIPLVENKLPSQLTLGESATPIVQP